MIYDPWSGSEFGPEYGQWCRRLKAWQDHYSNKGYNINKSRDLALKKVCAKSTWPPKV